VLAAPPPPPPPPQALSSVNAAPSNSSLNFVRCRIICFTSLVMPIYQLQLYWSTTTFSRVFETDAVLLALPGDDTAPLLEYRDTVFFLRSLKKQSTEDAPPIQRALDQYLPLSILV